ncbi:Molybdenum cofactor biosynthesis protein (MoaC) [Penicillium sp. IBT 35674x]|nr:Molybdenum cofactor biosynthesis protein (MoaC) [Penicillium sp. IBT 35674x]
MPNYGNFAEKDKCRPLAGNRAAKRTPDLVALSHPGISITGLEVNVVPVELDEKIPENYGATRDCRNSKSFWTDIEVVH